jgi:hypothetical protein
LRFRRSNLVRRMRRLAPPGFPIICRRQRSFFSCSQGRVA